MRQDGASFYAPQRALETIGGDLWRDSQALSSDDACVPGLRACTETLQHLPPRRAASILVHPEEPLRCVEWASCVSYYAMFLARLQATEDAYCSNQVVDLASTPYAPPATGKVPRIVLPSTQGQVDAARPVDGAISKGVLHEHLIAALPALELRVHDGATVWAPKAIVRFGVRCLQVLWMGAAAGRDVERLTLWLRDLFSAFWMWTRRPADVSDEEHAARILALSHRIAAEVRQLHGRPPVWLPRYPVFLRSGARRFLALNARTAADLIDEPHADVEAKLGVAYGLKILPADEAADAMLDHRIAFGDAIPAPPDDPAIVHASAGSDAPPIRRGRRFVCFERVPPHLAKVHELRASRQLRPFKASRAWFRAVQRASECVLLERMSLVSVEERGRVREELASAHSDLVGELWAAEERKRAHQIATYTEHHFGQRLVPPLPPTLEGEMRLRRGDKASQAAIDWENSELVPGKNETRGTVKRVMRFGVQDAAGVVHPGRVALAKGPPAAASRLSREIARLAADLDWVTLDLAAVAREAELVEQASDRCDADFFQDRGRELGALEGWLKTLERDVGEDPERAQRVSRVHIALLQRAAQLGAPLSPFLTVTRLGNVTLDPAIVEVYYAYCEDSVPLDVLGILRTGLLADGQHPRIMVSRGPRAPAWAAQLQAAAKVAPGTVADLEAEFQRAWTTEPAFETAAWRAHFIERLLRACSGTMDTSRPVLEAVQATLTAAPDMSRFQLVPDAGAAGDAASLQNVPSGPELDAGVTWWFTDDIPADQVVSVERPGLYERLADGSGRWHVPPRITMSAGLHTEFTRRAQPALQSCMQWLELGPFSKGKRRKYVQLMKTRVLDLFRELAGGAAHEGGGLQAAVRLLCDGRGVIAFLCRSACRDEGVLGIVEALAVDSGITVEPLGGDGFAPADAAQVDPVPVLIASVGGGDQGGRVFRGTLARPVESVAGVALELVRCLGRRDDVDPEAREARAVADTLMSLADPQCNLESSAIFLATKAHTLLPATAEPSDAPADSALGELHAAVQRTLRPLGLSLSPIQIGEDVREHGGRYRARPGSVNWRVTCVLRPCLLKGEQVVQLGIVETD